VPEKKEVGSTVIRAERITSSAIHTDHDHDKNIYRATKIEITGENLEHIL
jgi:hypothetical protein